MFWSQGIYVGNVLFWDLLCPQEIYQARHEDIVKKKKKNSIKMSGEALHIIELAHHLNVNFSGWANIVKSNDSIILN